MTTPLRKLRQFRKITLAQAAKAIGVSAGSLSKIEREQQEPSTRTATRIASYFGHPLTESHILFPERYEDFDPAATSGSGQKQK